MKENIIQLTEADLNGSKYDTKKVNISIHYLDKDGKAVTIKIGKNKTIGGTYTMTKEGATKGNCLDVIKEDIEKAVAQGVAAIRIFVGSPLDIELPVQYTLVVEDGKLIRK